MLKRKRRSKVDLITDIVFVILLVLIGLIALYPLWFVIIASISDPLAIGRGEVIFLPKDINFSAYRMLLNNSRIWVGYVHQYRSCFHRLQQRLCMHRSSQGGRL